MSTAASAVASSKQWLQSLFQQKGATRPLKFQMQLTIHELEQYPQSSTLFVKWKDGAGNSGETRVVGASVSSSGHQYTWDETFPFLASFLVDNATNVPLPRMLHLSVRQVNVRTGSVKRVGVVDANLSEFLCSLPRPAAYVLCDTKANAFIRVSLCAKQLMGDPLFRCPLQAQDDPPPSPSPYQQRRRSLSATPPPKDTKDQAVAGGTGAGSLALAPSRAAHGPSRSLVLPASAPPSRPPTHEQQQQQQQQEQRRSFSYAEFARFAAESRVLRDSLDLSTSGTTPEQGPSTGTEDDSSLEAVERRLEQLFAAPPLNEQPPPTPTPPKKPPKPKTAQPPPPTHSNEGGHSAAGAL